MVGGDWRTICGGAAWRCFLAPSLAGNRRLVCSRGNPCRSGLRRRKQQPATEKPGDACRQLHHHGYGHERFDHAHYQRELDGPVTFWPVRRRAMRFLSVARRSSTRPFCYTGSHDTMQSSEDSIFQSVPLPLCKTQVSYRLQSCDRQGYHYLVSTAMPPWQALRAEWLQAHNGHRSI